MLQFHFLVSVCIADSKLDDDMMAQDEGRRARGEGGEEGMEARQGGVGKQRNGGVHTDLSLQPFPFHLRTSCPCLHAH